MLNELEPAFSLNDGVRRGAIFMPTGSLPGEDYRGTMSDAVDFVDILGKVGLHWARLPSTPPSSTSGSPYSGPSAFAGDTHILGL